MRKIPRGANSTMANIAIKYNAASLLSFQGCWEQRQSNNMLTNKSLID